MTHIGLIFGGQSPEYEVSIQSAACLLQMLRAASYRVTPIGIHLNGSWHIGDDAFEKLAQKPQRLKGAAPINRDLQALAELRLDLVFPMIHGISGSDGSLHGYCELLGIPFIGGSSLNMTLTHDKLATRWALEAHKISQPRFLALYRARFEPRSAMNQIEASFGYPLFVKPARTGSSLGISRVENREQLATALALAMQYDYRVIVEERLNARELRIAGIGPDEPFFSPVGEIFPIKSFFDADEKRRGVSFQIPAAISDAQDEQIRQIASQAWIALDCWGMARLDFYLTDRQIYLNKIKTIPSFTPNSLYMRLLQSSRWTSEQVLKRLVQLALDRKRLRVRKIQIEEGLS